MKHQALHDHIFMDKLSEENEVRNFITQAFDKMRDH